MKSHYFGSSILTKVSRSTAVGNADKHTSLYINGCGQSRDGAYQQLLGLTFTKGPNPTLSALPPNGSRVTGDQITIACPEQFPDPALREVVPAVPRPATSAALGGTRCGAHAAWGNWERSPMEWTLRMGETGNNSK